jgi:hypothetical protein
MSLQRVDEGAPISDRCTLVTGHVISTHYCSDRKREFINSETFIQTSNSSVA